MVKTCGDLFMQNIAHQRSIKNRSISFSLSIMCVWVCCMISNGVICTQRDKTNIYQVDTFDLLQQEVKTLDNNDLVIFDVDGVLLIEDDAIFGVNAENKALWQKFFRARLSALPSDQVKNVYSIVRQQSTCHLIDDTVVKIITGLQEKGIKTIALTAMRTGNYGIIERLEDWRFAQLKNVGIDFSSSFDLDEPLMLFPQEKYSEHALNQSRSLVFAKKGIVFAGEYSKGNVLKLFLTAVNMHPKHIIFIDDTRDCVESVAKACEELNIEFTGFHYGGAAAISKPVDDTVASIQVDYLFKHKKWLSDQQAKELMQQYA
jgi:hypothetical protein